MKIMSGKPDRKRMANGLGAAEWAMCVSSWSCTECIFCYLDLKNWGDK